MALYFKYEGRKQPLLEHRDDLTPAIVAAFVRNGISVMPMYRKTEISDAELAALGAWLAARSREAGNKPPLPPFPPPPPRP